MSTHEEGALEAFAETIRSNLEKNGFPQRPVAFPIEHLYEAAARRGLSFNRVLEVLAGQGVAHEKTPERVIFRVPPAPSNAADPFEGLDLSGIDMSALQNMSPDQMMAAAAQAMQQLSPEQLQSLQGMVEGLTPEDQERMIEQAKKLGLV